MDEVIIVQAVIITSRLKEVRRDGISRNSTVTRGGVLFTDALNLESHPCARQA
jgi:hypothetical protein